MKKENLFLIMNTILLVGISLIVLYVVYPTLLVEPKDQLFGETIKLENREVVEEIPAESSFAVITHKETALNQKGEVVGTVYTVLAHNPWKFDPSDESGVIELLVGIQGEYVFVQILQLRQSSYFLASIQAYVNHFFNGVHYLDVEAIEIVNVLEPLAGATIAADSKETIKEMVFNVVVLHFELEDDEEPDPFVDLFDENYAYSLKDEAFTETTHVKERFVAYNSVDERIGYVYRLHGFGVYNDSGSSGVIEMYLVLDENLNILAYQYITYGHTAGGFRGRINSYLNLMIGANISSFNEGINLDIIVGSTYSAELIDQMLTDLSVVVAEYTEPDPYARFFDASLSYTEINDAFVETTHVKVMYTAYNSDDEVIGYVYQLYGFGYYYENSSSIEMYVALDANLNILAYEYITYGHSTFGAYRTRITNYLNMMIGANILNFNDDADLQGGSTYTAELIDAMLTNLGEVVTG
jgi:hypothetical protein